MILQTRLNIYVFALFTLFLTSASFAGDTRASVSLGVIPYSTKPPAFPQAFNGMGFSVGVAVYPFGRSGFAANFLRSGTASVFTMNYRYYFVGEPQGTVIKMKELPTDREKQPMVLTRRGWGVFAEGGVGYYTATRLEVTADSKVENGLAAMIGAGAEYPVYQNFFSQIRLGSVQNLSRNFSTIYVELAVCLAFGL